MPLHEGEGKAVVSKNIREMMHSDTFAKGKSRKKKNLMAVAAAMRKSRGGKARPKRSLAKDAMKK
jgi:hypothetical protein